MNQTSADITIRTARADDLPELQRAFVAASLREPELEDLFVGPDVRRRGVARRLVADAVSDAEAAGHRRIWVTATSMCSTPRTAEG